jgi:predicted MPP superfamily phosphohydrolase
LNGLPEVFKQLKIIQISDIHAGSFDNTDAVLHGINMMVDEKPDLILFTGDLVNYRTSEITVFKEMFKKLKAPLGIYSILGNHDYSDYLHWPTEIDKRNDFNQMISCHKDLGWNLLRNEHITLDWKGSPFAIIGSENWSIKERFPKYGDMNKAMAGLNRADIPLKILMTHDPSHWDAVVRPNYPDIQLTLSGHTHGMQLGIEIPGIKWSPAQYLYKQWAGLYQEKDQFLYVNRGYGFIGYDGRLGIMPEITVLEFS